MAIRAVWFDVGETLIDESREYGTWADWLGVPRHTFSAVFGAVIARGGDYREVFQHFRPGFDLVQNARRGWMLGLGEYLNGHDLYADARPCLQALRDAGYFVGVAGNQTARAGRFLRELNLPCDVLATSDEWGVAKPDPGSSTSWPRSPVTLGPRSPMSVTGWTTTSPQLPRPGCSPSGSGAARGGTFSSPASRQWPAFLMALRL